MPELGLKPARELIANLEGMTAEELEQRNNLRQLANHAMYMLKEAIREAMDRCKEYNGSVKRIRINPGYLAFLENKRMDLVLNFLGTPIVSDSEVTEEQVFTVDPK